MIYFRLEVMASSLQNFLFITASTRKSKSIQQYIFPNTSKYIQSSIQISYRFPAEDPFCSKQETSFIKVKKNSKNKIGNEKWKEADLTHTLLFLYLSGHLFLASAAGTGSPTNQQPLGSAAGDFFCLLESSDGLFFSAESFLFCSSFAISNQI